MNQYVWMILISFSPLLALSQGIKLIAETNNGKTDTVIFGYNDNATIGIDSILGEKDISGEPTKEVDMRIVQRDSLNFSCTYTFSADLLDTFQHFFPKKFDSKVNFRKSKDTSFINRIFEVKFLTKNVHVLYMYPLTNQSNFPYPVLDTFSFFVDSCLNKVNLVTILWNPNNPNFVPIYTGSSQFSNLIFVFKKGFILKNQDKIEIVTAKVYPNPFSSQVFITGFQNKDTKSIRIYDILGREVFSKKDDFGEPIELNLTHLNQGTFLLTAFDASNLPIFNKTIIKQ